MNTFETCYFVHVIYLYKWVCWYLWMHFLFVTALRRFPSDDSLVTSSKDSHQTCSALERSIAAETEDLIESECDTYFFLWSLHLHLFWQGTMWEEEGVIFKLCCFAVRVKVNLPAQEPKLTSPQVDGDSGENELVIFVDNIQRRI